jgi:hypothetical protein
VAVEDATHDIEIVGYARGGHRLTPLRQSTWPALVESGLRPPIIGPFATGRGGISPKTGRVVRSIT